MSERFVVVAHPKHDRELWEPVHPGHIDRIDARKLDYVLKGKGITHEVWTDEEWNRYDDQIREELFDEDGNERKEA